MEGRGGRVRAREIISVMTAWTIFAYCCILEKDEFTEINQLNIKDGNNTF